MDNQKAIISGAVGLALFLAAAGAMVAILFGGFAGGGNSRTGGAAPAFSGLSTGGAKISLDEYAGQVVVLDFWATWCPPCREKIPELMAIQKDFYDEGVRVIGISGDRSVEVLADYERKHSINFPTIFEGADAILRAYEIRAFPTIVVIDKQGRVVFRGHGGNVRGAVEQALRG